jgi:D-glycero-D-manno-heptose 1,7-bisphosphate phosphatase
MLLQAAEKYNLDLEHSIMIGDKVSDMQAAKNAGVGIRCHYLTIENQDEFSSAATCRIYSLREGILQLSGTA